MSRGSIIASVADDCLHDSERVNEWLLVRAFDKRSLFVANGVR